MKNTINETRIKTGQQPIDFNNINRNTLLKFNKETSFTYHTKQMMYNYMLLDYIWLKSIKYPPNTFIHNCFFNNYLCSFKFSRKNKYLYDYIQFLPDPANADISLDKTLPVNILKLKNRYYDYGRKYERNIKLEALILTG